MRFNEKTEVPLFILYHPLAISFQNMNVTRIWNCPLVSEVTTECAIIRADRHHDGPRLYWLPRLRLGLHVDVSNNINGK